MDVKETILQDTMIELTDYIKFFLDSRFPQGLEGNMKIILTEIISDVFHDGARFAETAAKDEARVII
jgi:hypothetical protein